MAGLFDAAQLAAMAAVTESAMPDTVTVLRPTTTVDELGSAAKTWAVAFTCRGRIGQRAVRHPGGDEPTIAGLAVSVTPYKLTYPSGVQLSSADRVTVGAVTFEVARVADRASWNVENIAWLVEVGRNA